MVELCRRLDDVPLALELAAGQLRRFDLAELTRRLDDRLGLLAGRPTGEGRHTTMETAIDWSYRLLDPAEQALLRHLSVFPASFTLRGGGVRSRRRAATARATMPSASSATSSTRAWSCGCPAPAATGCWRRSGSSPATGWSRPGRRTARSSATARQVRERAVASTRLDRWLSARRAAAYRADLDDARQAFRRSLDQGEAGDALEIAVAASFLWRNALRVRRG